MDFLSKAMEGLTRNEKIELYASLKQRSIPSRSM